MKSKAPQMPNDQWFILKGESRFGPYTFEEVVRMLQDKSIFEFDFAWAAKMDSWKRLAEIGDFSAENIRHFDHLFIKRAHKRKKFEGLALVHDNQNLWKGQGIELSDGGAGIIMNNSMLLPGQTVFVHFKPLENMPPFNAICEIVSKKYAGAARDTNTEVQYGLKFKSLNVQAQKIVHGYKAK